MRLLNILVLLACLAFAASQLPKQLQVMSNLKYKRIFAEPGPDSCDYNTEPCAKLNDIWGYEFEDQGVQKYFAIVGMENGIDIVDVTVPTDPQRVKFIPGCINNWRDMKHWGTTIYGISEYTQTCACPSGERCLELMNVTSPQSVEGAYKMTEGRQTPQLTTVGPKSGNLVAVEPWDDKACNIITNGADIAGHIALILRGDCSYTQKILMAQNAGAIAVVIESETDDIIYPGMTGWQNYHENVTIPAVMIGNSDGEMLRTTSNVVITLDASVREFSDLFKPAEGVTVINMDNPYDPKLDGRLTNEFMYSHNVYVEKERPIMYVCGTTNGKFREGNVTFDYVANGGLVIYDVSQPTPQLLNTWNTTYIHDMMVHECDGKHYLFGASITDDDVYIWDADDPSNLVQKMVFHARQGSAHNIWVDKTCRVMYVTHERVNEPITVWQFFEDAQGMIDWDAQPKYLGSLASNQFQGTLPHNVLVEGDILWAAYYSEGVIAWDISTPTHPTLMAHYETSDFPGGFFGVWGVYPFASNGLIYASDREEGLFVLKLVDSPEASEPTSYKSAAIGFGVFALFLLVLLIIVGIVLFVSRSKGYSSV